jgi:lysophospholipase L1-like esterase
MKPFKIFLFGLSVLVSVFFITLIFQDKSIYLGNLEIKLPSFDIQYVNKKTSYKDISRIIQFSSLLNDTLPDKKTDTVVNANTPKKEVVVKKNIVRLNTDSIKKLVRYIEYPDSADTLLFPFFENLFKLASSKELIRVLHYGDSQIEGDRITSYLRNQLQKQFGGEGIGLIPIVAINPASISYNCDVSENWERITLLNPNKKIKNSKYGVLTNYAIITPSQSIFSKGEKKLDAWIKLKHSNLSYPLAQRFRLCNIYYGFNKEPMLVELKKENSLLDAEILPSTSKLNKIKWSFENPVKNLLITFKATESPNVYAISLDSDKGIAVDNIPLRGSSGLEFSKMDVNFLSTFYNMLNVRLIILQFGVNVVPNIASDYSYYQNNFFKQLTILKKTRPNLPIIVIGVSDVSRNGKNGFESYPNIELIRNAQKQAAFDAGCPFWDIYEAMGGKNSMPSWVHATPPLANKDFIHFSPLGSKIIGEMFYQSLMIEYEKYLRTKNLSMK